ncbi:MAG: prepilin peptidase [Butyrivibrio sp.]
MATIYISGSMTAVTVILLYIVLAAAAFTDIYKKTIPLAVDIILLAIGVLSIWTVPGISVAEHLIGAACISVPMILIDLAVHEAFGGGDIKFMAAAGFFLGWKAAIVAFCIAVLSGGVYAAVMLVTRRKKKKDHFAFAPFLCVGIAIAAFKGYGTYWFDSIIFMIKTVFTAMQRGV